MINLRSVDEVLENTRVVMRMDLDMPKDGDVITDWSRVEKSLPTIRTLLSKNCHILIVGTWGRPGGKEVPELSLREVYLELVSMLNTTEVETKSVFVADVFDTQLIDTSLADNQIVFMENLGFWPGEDANDPLFLENIAEICQFFVNDSFAKAHRKSASVMLREKLPVFYGYSFIEEARALEALVENTQRPLTVVLGGAKKDKLDYLPNLLEMADNVLVGGALPKVISMEGLEPLVGTKLIVAKLRDDGLDLDDDTIEKFSQIIGQSKTVVWAGSMGFYENPEARAGTEAIARAVSEVEGYTVVAGGDTGASLIDLGVEGKIDFFCSGGGVMLEYLTNRTLPAWEEVLTKV
jgi:3-phosphoglycerate kinase